MKKVGKGLQIIPGMGPRLAYKFEKYLDMDRPSCFKGENPDALYRKLERKMGAHVDRCVLYVLSECVYYANHKRPDPRKLKWWNWKD